MKILKESAEDQEFWIGKEIKCDCGLHAILEASDDDGKRIRKYSGAIDFICDCKRFIYIDGNNYE